MRLSGRALRVRVAAGFAAAATIFGGCKIDLGACDEEAARAVAYSTTGLPAYEGQALIQTSCGSGAFCHSEAALKDSRFGVPKGLDFDMRLASTTAAAEPDRTERLRRGWREIRSWRHEAYSLVESGEMPPGQVGRSVQAGSELYRRFDGRVYTDLPTVDSDEGLSILKNWLACDCPVVERTEGDPIFGEVVPREGAHIPDPEFSSIYELVLAPACAASCHGPAIPSQFELSQLDLSEPDLAYESLVSEAARGDECGETGSVLVVPGDAANSLLLQKITPGTEVCGDAMPLGGAELDSETLDAIAQWIDEGAER